HEIDDDQRDRLHAEDERLIDAALTRLVPSLEAAPDSDEGARKGRKPASQTTKKTRTRVRQRPSANRPGPVAQQEIAAIGNEQAADHFPIGAGVKIEQQINASRHAKNATDQVDRQTAPID